MAIFGVDEAGRGPVMGSMFVSIVKVESNEEILGEVKDSKDLSYETIHKIAENNEAVDHVTLEVNNKEIDAGNITTLAIDTMGEGLLQLGASKTDQIYVDACHPNEETFESLLAESLGWETTEPIQGEHGADERYDIVSLASIFAKSSRERHVEKIKKEFSIDMGSGYPSDPTTRSFLEKYVGENNALPPFARQSWSTCQDLL